MIVRMMTSRRLRVRADPVTLVTLNGKAQGLERYRVIGSTVAAVGVFGIVANKTAELALPEPLFYELNK